jgi:hypothetical protein
LFRHACKMGLEGIVSKRRDSSYRSGRSPDWVRMKNPACAQAAPPLNCSLPAGAPSTLNSGRACLRRADAGDQLGQRGGGGGTIYFLQR